MTELKFRRHSRRIANKGELLPLEIYLRDKLCKIAEGNSSESIIAVNDLAKMGHFESLSSRKILQDKFKAMEIIKHIRIGILDKVTEAHKLILRRIIAIAKDLPEKQLEMFLDCLLLARMKNAFAKLASYAFTTSSDIENQIEIDVSKIVEKNQRLGKMICRKVSSEGGPSAFLETEYHEEVLLTVCAFHESFGERIRAIGSYFSNEFFDCLKLKEVTLATPYPESAKIILEKLVSAQMIDACDLESGHEDSIMMWYIDSITFRGRDDELTKYLKQMMVEKGATEKKIDKILLDSTGIGNQVLN